MGDVISIEALRARRSGAAQDGQPGRGGAASHRPQTTFAFDLSSPWTYFAAERVDRMFTRVVWKPVTAEALHAGTVAGTSNLEREDVMATAEARALQLRMPLSWPDRYPEAGRAAMRVAAFAAERGRAAEFALAASRLAFCGGFDLDDPEILAEAAAAASLGLDACLQAAGDRRRDGAMEAAGRALLARGVDRLPALQVGRLVFCGEERVAEAAAAARNPLVSARPRATEPTAAPVEPGAGSLA